MPKSVDELLQKMSDDFKDSNPGRLILKKPREFYIQLNPSLADDDTKSWVFFPKRDYFKCRENLIFMIPCFSKFTLLDIGTSSVFRNYYNLLSHNNTVHVFIHPKPADVFDCELFNAAYFCRAILLKVPGIKLVIHFIKGSYERHAVYFCFDRILLGSLNEKRIRFIEEHDGSFTDFKFMSHQNTTQHPEVFLHGLKEVSLGYRSIKTNIPTEEPFVNGIRIKVGPCWKDPAFSAYDVLGVFMNAQHRCDTFPVVCTDFARNTLRVQ